jgi:pimeloyl-ACP methyl ester carboxylesterase
MRAVIRLTAIAIAVMVAAAACGGGTGETNGGADARPRPARPAPAARPVGAVDELVSVHGGRLHLRCAGSGAATVVLVAGWGQGADAWSAVEPTIGRRARVCAYDRFGTGTSDPPSATQTFESQAADLHELLHAVGELGPYVVVGHSFGGAQAVTFASLYPAEVAGLVLVDASPVTWPSTVCEVPAYASGCAVMRDPDLDPERLDVFRAFAAVARIGSLGRLPMSVVTAAHRSPVGLSPDELAGLDAAWRAGSEGWARLSSRSRILVVDDTGHDIHSDQPAIVVEQVLALLP